MTDPDPRQTPITSVWLWLGQPEVGAEHLLMVQVQEPDVGVVFRPLMAVTEASALHEQTRDLATQAAAQLGVRAVLREYRVEFIGDQPAILDEVTP